MLKKILFSFTIILSLIPIYFVSAATNDVDNKTTYLITFKDEVDEDLILNTGGEIIKIHHELQIIQAKLTDEQSKLISKEVESIERDNAVRLTSGILTNNNIHNLDEMWGFNHIEASEAHDTGISGKGVKIAVLDTGIDIDHEDLKYNKGKSFLIEEPNIDDTNGHGTQVAGIITAQSNDIGITGVSFNAELYVGKVLNHNGNGNISDVISGINWSVSNGVDIISMSFGTYEPSKALKKAINEAYKKNILIVAAAGNKGDKTISYPAKYSAAIAVGAINNESQLSGFSNYGKLEVVAPGENIYSTFINNSYKYESGTSMAVPYVTGTLALIIENQPEIMKKKIRKIMNDSSMFINKNYVINALNAVNISNTNN